MSVRKDVDPHTADIIYCLNPACRAVFQLSGYIAVRCQDCGGFFTNVEPDWNAGLSQPATLAVIACSKQKSGIGGEIPAHRRYTGPLFRAQLAYARTGLGLADADIYVASAKLGLVGISDLIPDYNLALHQLSVGQRRRWGWRVALGLRGRNPRRVYLLAGKLYREWISYWLPGVEIALPVTGLGYARQVQWYKQAVNNV